MERISYHEPVMVKEIMKFLQLKKGMKVVDATIGTGGHAQEILKRITPDGFLVGIDRDGESLRAAQERLRDYGAYAQFVCDNFFNTDRVLSSLSMKSVDGILLDLGISSYQLNDPDRGFSFVNEGPLDMRMDRSISSDARILVNTLPEKELADILWKFAQERYSRRIASMIVREREAKEIKTTTQLAAVVLRAVRRPRSKQRIHPATRTFQALRIAVNHELDSLEKFLVTVGSLLNAQGRICIISFHSLEDRIVKNAFRSLAHTKAFRCVEKKPVTASEEEISCNPRARSAKLRILEKV